jgi:hypothetical protein
MPQIGGEWSVEGFDERARRILTAGAFLACD